MYPYALAILPFLAEKGEIYRKIGKFQRISWEFHWDLKG